MNSKLLVIGICGVTCGGKSTLASQLSKIFINSRVIDQDSYFLDVDDPRHVWVPELNHINFDILTSLDMEKLHADISEIVAQKSKENVKLNESEIEKLPENLRNMLLEIVKKTNLRLLIIEGFSIFNYKPLLPFFDLKYYFTLPKEECFRRRSNRVYDPPDCEGYFDKVAWPEHLKQYEEVKRNVTDIKYCNQDFEEIIKEVITDIIKFFK